MNNLYMNYERLLFEFSLTESEFSESSFSQTHKVCNVGIIANFVFPYFCCFLLYLHQHMLANVKIEIKGCTRIIFEV